MASNQEWTISYKQIGTVIFAFSLGVIAALLVSNSQTPSVISFSTTELIGFVLSVILSGASIVLAISAIALGKSSEKSVIERSDESIRLQNEVFVRTTEALQRIEASTGVTEKRIEDIITGRVGDISQKIVGLASEGQLGSRQGKKDFEEEIKETLLSAIKGTQANGNTNIYDQKISEKKIKEEMYEENHQKLFSTIKSIPDVIVGKYGHGASHKKGDDQVDGIFTINNERIGISTYRFDVSEDQLDEYFRGIATQIEGGNFSRVVVFAFDAKGFENTVTEILKPYKDELKNKISFKTVDTNNYDEKIIQEIVSNKPIKRD